MPASKLKALKQVAALPVIYDPTGTLRVMLITSRETKRLIIPKGWPMKGRRNYRAAAIEAQQEACLIRRVYCKPIGAYTYWKRKADHFLYVRVRVFVLEVIRQLVAWPEKEQRRGAWLLIDDAAELVDDPGLGAIIRGLPATLLRKRKPPTSKKADQRRQNGRR